jgi:hypothetical protein
MNLPAVSVEFLSALAVLDEAIARSVQMAGCPRCGGPLYQANYHRKPRGLSLDDAHSTITLRHSLCCGRDGCRRRTLPPSLRYFGRRVYLLAVVVFAAAFAHATASVRAAGERFSVPSQTVGRWAEWWRTVAPVTVWWRELRGRIAGSIDTDALPLSLLEHVRPYAGDDPTTANTVTRFVASGNGWFHAHDSRSMRAPSRPRPRLWLAQEMKNPYELAVFSPI